MLVEYLAWLNDVEVVCLVVTLEVAGGASVESMNGVVVDDVDFRDAVVGDVDGRDAVFGDVDGRDVEGIDVDEATP